MSQRMGLTIIIVLIFMVQITLYSNFLSSITTIHKNHPFLTTTAVMGFLGGTILWNKSSKLNFLLFNQGLPSKKQSQTLQAKKSMQSIEYDNSDSDDTDEDDDYDNQEANFVKILGKASFLYMLHNINIKAFAYRIGSLASFSISLGAFMKLAVHINKETDSHIISSLYKRLRIR